MALWIVLTITTLLLMTAESEQTPNATETPLPTQPNNTTRKCSCSGSDSTTSADPTSNPRSRTMGLLTIKWTAQCTGYVNLTLLSQASLLVCHGSKTVVASVLMNVCENKKGCTGPLNWPESQDMQDGYDITEDGGYGTSSCKTLRVRCKVEVLPDVQGQLKAYKVVTALLICLLLVLIVIRFTRPTITALQKRLSDRRQSRWVGPTQSHSVSYHRGKSAVKNEGEKRFSYPALERLAVSDSREPSSNRNSDYNF